MPVLQLNDQQFPLSQAPVRIGGGSDAEVALPCDPSVGVQAVIERSAAHALVIRRATPTAVVRLNGVVLGAEPTPLMHGDRLEIAGCELRYADDAKAGATQFVNASGLAAMTGAKRAGAARATSASGGRLVSLVDGKEYLVPETGVVIGRDASCDIVVGQTEVSRRHAEIAPSDGGYLVRDTSANGVFVNGERIQGSHRLMRADVVRIGGEEFRFYADIAAAAAVVPADSRAPEPVPVVESASPSPSPAPAPPAPTPAPAVPAPRAAVKTFDELPTAPSPRQTAPAPAPRLPEAPDTRAVLATLESLNEGPTKGVRTALRTPLAHIGRGAHNDVQLADESVSETHAKLQRREDGWYLVDMSSTNGSYVGGSRVVGERRLDGMPDLRFGGVKLRFIPTGGGAAGEAEGKGTRAIAAIDRPRPSVAPPVSVEVPPSSGTLPAWMWILAALVIGAAAFLLLRGRA